MCIYGAITGSASLLPSVMRAATISSLIVCSLLPTTTLALSAEEWRQKSIYQVCPPFFACLFTLSRWSHVRICVHGMASLQVMTDRFALPNDNGTQCDTSERKYCGGSWQGIINHLDYIQNMGFDAIWISPVAANLEGSTTEGEAFHGSVPLAITFSAFCHSRRFMFLAGRYWTKDMTNINDHFGSTDDLHALSKALHKRGMYLMFDVVLNHMAAPTLKDFNFSNFFQPFTDDSYFHKQCWVNGSTDQATIEQCWLGDPSLPLPDLDTDNVAVADTLKKMVTDLVAKYEVDGLRLDTVKHINKAFWKDFRDNVDVFMMGEVLTNETSYAAAYTGRITYHYLVTLIC